MNVWVAISFLAVNMGTRKNSTLALVIAAALAALGVITLALGSVVQVLDLSVAVIASLFVVFAVIELGGSYPYLLYAVTSLLAMLLLPTKTAALAYVCFTGYYPIIKSKLEKSRLPRFACWLCKILVFNVVLALVVLVAVLVLHLPVPRAYYWMLLLLTPVFVLYDVALTRLISFYIVRLRDRLKFLNK